MSGLIMRNSLECITRKINSKTPLPSNYEEWL